ncbi:MAG: hypothetical protein MUD12_09945 [Spirochaetes bacterium]|jgi:hypothetical protein|nr:hypothetical protein [Spirochaetota bacterium]
MNNNYSAKTGELINKAIIDNKRIRIIAYSVSENVEQKLHTVLELMLKKYKKPDLLPALYTIVKELLINAIKANFKNIYFEDYRSKNNSENIINYETALKLFKLEISREKASNLERIARKQKIRALVDIFWENGNLNVYVTNPSRMTDLELENVNKKLKAARVFDDITEYFMNNDDDEYKEGAGLGLILISMMIKNLGVPQDKFSINTLEDKTVASLRLPLELL